MKILILIFFFILSNCTLNKVNKHHGVHFLKKKKEFLKINKTNKNDIIKIIGPPSSKSNFNENIWLYIERRKTNQSLFKMGVKKIEKNNILIVEFNNMGILKNKEFIDSEKMNDVKFVKSITNKEFKKNSFVYEILTSLREKINAPARNRSKNRN